MSALSALTTLSGSESVVKTNSELLESITLRRATLNLRRRIVLDGSVNSIYVELSWSNTELNIKMVKILMMK